TVQELLGHKSLNTTMIYTHVAKRNILGVKSPLDRSF
ncbi:MAG: integron integrase, partial [Nitrospirae bacterium]